MPGQLVFFPVSIQPGKGDSLNETLLWQIRQDTVVELAQIDDGYSRFVDTYQVHAFQGHHYFLAEEDGGFPFDSLELWRTDGSLHQKEMVQSFGTQVSPGVFLLGS